jgi:hypothetical protein
VSGVTPFSPAGEEREARMNSYGSFCGTLWSPQAGDHSSQSPNYTIPVASHTSVHNLFIKLSSNDQAPGCHPPPPGPQTQLAHTLSPLHLTFLRVPVAMSFLHLISSAPHIVFQHVTFRMSNVNHSAPLSPVGALPLVPHSLPPAITTQPTPLSESQDCQAGGGRPQEAPGLQVQPSAGTKGTSSLPKLTWL